MALIPCKKCGSIISDKAVRCPKCGWMPTADVDTEVAAAPQEETVSAHDIQPQSPSVPETHINESKTPEEQITPAPIHTINETETKTEPIELNHDNVTNNQSSLKTWLWIILSILVLAGIGIAGHLYNRKTVEKAEQVRLQAHQDSVAKVQREAARLEQLRQDSIRQANERISLLKKSIYSQMENVLITLRDGEMSGFYEYFLTDLNNDGISELWTITGTCTADSQISVYSVDENNRLKKKETDYTGAWNCSYHIGEGYVLECYGKQGYGAWRKLTIGNNRINSKVIFEESLRDGEYEYTDPKEPKADKHLISDLTVLRNAFDIQ